MKDEGMDDNRFIDAGYTKYRGSPLDRSDYILQKRITDELGTKYFITFSAYFHEGKTSYQPDVQFREGKYPTANMVLFSDDINVVEGLYEHIWRELGRPYYERNDE